MVSGKRLFWPNINERCHTLFYWPTKFHWHSPLISRNQLKMTNFQNIPVIRVLPWNISSNCLNLKIQNFTWLHLFHFSPQCIIKCVPMRGCKITQVAFVCLFSIVCFRMCPQIACMRRCIITQVAFVWLFSSVPFQMCLQIACPRGCKITEIAFVCLFSTMGFQMFPRWTWSRAGILTLVAFNCLFSTVHF